MDPARQALAKALNTGEPTSDRALAKRSGVARSTFNARKLGRPSLKEKAQRQQYLTVEEEKALSAFLSLMARLGRPVRVKHIPSLAFSLANRRSTTNKPIKSPHVSWTRAFKRRHPELNAKKVKAIDWKRHENNVYDKIIEWFDVIEKVFKDPAVEKKNVYNMDETGIMLSMLGSIKVLVGKDDVRDYRGAGIKRTMVTAIECISADGRSLQPLIIWPASTHRSNWTTSPTPGWHYGHS